VQRDFLKGNTSKSERVALKIENILSAYENEGEIFWGAWWDGLRGLEGGNHSA